MLRALLALVAILLLSLPAFAGGAADADAGVARMGANDARAAIDLFTRAIQSRDLSQESLALTYHRRGMAFYMDGEAGRAILDYTIALWHEDLPKDFRPRTLNNRGLAFEAISDYETAIRDYSLSIRLNPSYAEPYANRGNLHRKFNRHGEAISDYDMALRSGHPHPKFVFAWQGLSFEALGKRQEAADVFRRALSIDPGFELAKLHLAKLDHVQTLNGIVGRRKQAQGIGGPLIIVGAPGNQSRAPGADTNLSATPWVPPASKAPSILSAEQPIETQAPGVGLRPAVEDAAHTRPAVISPLESEVPVVEPPPPVAPAHLSAADGEGGSDAEYLIQLGSFNTKQLAQTGWAKASHAAKELLTGLNHTIEAVQLPNIGQVFRLYAGALPDRQSALSLCRTLRDKGSACIVVRR